MAFRYLTANWLAALFLSWQCVVANAAPFISVNPAPPFEITARARNGGSGFEAVLFTPGNTGGDTLNPTGAPVWNYALTYNFEFQYAPATGTATWRIDFNRDGDYLDSQESTTRISPSLVNMGFEYVNVLGTGNSTAFATLTNFTINGTNHGNFATNATTQSFSQLYEESLGLFTNLTVTGTLNFSANGGSERPRIWVQLGSPKPDPLLVGRWALDEVSGTIAADSSGTGNHGTYVNTPALAQTGVYALATGFNGAPLNQYLSLPRAVVHQNTNISTTFWVKTTYTGEQSIVSGSNAAQSNEFLLFFGSQTEFRVYCHGSLRSWTIPSIADGQWHHFAVVSAASTNRTTVYRDGVSLGSQSISAGATPFSIDNGGLILAQEQDTVGGGFSTTQCLRGTLDDLRIYKRAISASEVMTIYGLKGHWAFNEGTGSTVADSSAAGLNATVNGAVWTSDCAGNTALDFDGIDDRATTNSNFKPPATGAVAFWMRASGPSSVRQRVFGISGDWEARLEPAGTISFDLGASPYVGNEPFSSTVVDELDRWYHVAVMFNESTDAYAVYVDGELTANGTSPVNLISQSAGILSFGTRTGSSEYWRGALRDFRIYDRFMTPTEIAKVSGTIARWQLNESSGTVAADSSVAANNASYVGSPTLGVSSSNSATNGTAVELNGTSQYLSSGKSLLNGLTKFTLAAWVRPDSLTPDKSFLGQNGLIELGIDTATDQIDLWTSNGGSLNATAQLAISKWSHVVAVGDGLGLKLFVNGVEVGSGGSVTASYGSNSGTFKIGEGVLSSSGTYFDGRFDDVRVYSRALCPEEINSLYQGGRPVGVRIIRWVETR